MTSAVHSSLAIRSIDGRNVISPGTRRSRHVAELLSAFIAVVSGQSSEVRLRRKLQRYERVRASLFGLIEGRRVVGALDRSVSADPPIRRSGDCLFSAQRSSVSVDRPAADRLWPTDCGRVLFCFRHTSTRSGFREATRSGRGLAFSTLYSFLGNKLMAAERERAWRRLFAHWTHGYPSTGTRVPIPSL